ncbi:MAG: hypothetical protein Q4D33_06665 [Prevotellaceae bacterium]|nr:hypothetical protein [Prevotellaceae bacterium]
MEKKIYKAPMSRVILLDAEEFLQAFDPGSKVGVRDGNILGREFDMEDVTYSKGGSWEMEW